MFYELKYLYVHHMYFKCTTFVCIKYEPMKDKFSHDLHYQIIKWKVYEK